jgi:hypothetical protein
MGSNAAVSIIPSPSGALRWRSLLGKVRSGSEVGRLLLFGECDRDEWRNRALISPNLKLALLVEEDSPSARELKSQWNCSHFALPTLLMAAALREALNWLAANRSNESLHVYLGAPVSPSHPPEQTARFERALHAALQLAHAWSDGVPRNAEVAIQAAELAWNRAEQLPPANERTTFVVPEAYAACEGVASVGGGVPLPIGRLCIVDMGGGTTDVAWVVHNGEGRYTPLRVDSFDIAGERLEAVLATEASSRLGRRVTRQEIWVAREAVSAQSSPLVGEGWSLSEVEIGKLLKEALTDLVKRMARSISKIDSPSGIAPPTKLIFVGGATKWALLAELFRDAITPLHKSLKIVSVEDFGVRGAIPDLPLAVALGLSQGFITLDPARWGSTLIEPGGVELESEPSMTMCRCRGLIFACVRCGGNGIDAFESSRNRYGASINPFAGPAFAIRCPYCGFDFSRERFFEHCETAHPEQAPSPPPPVPPTQPRVTRSDFDLERMKRWLRHEAAEPLAAQASNIASELRRMQIRCSRQSITATQYAIWFLGRTVTWYEWHPWLRLMRAILFAVIEDRYNMQRELRAANEAGLRCCDELGSILSSDRETRFAEAWEFILR